MPFLALRWIGDLRMPQRDAAVGLRGRRRGQLLQAVEQVEGNVAQVRVVDAGVRDAEIEIVHRQPLLEYLQDVVAAPLVLSLDALDVLAEIGGIGPLVAELLGIQVEQLGVGAGFFQPGDLPHSLHFFGKRALVEHGEILVALGREDTGLLEREIRIDVAAPAQQAALQRMAGIDADKGVAHVTLVSALGAERVAVGHQQQQDLVAAQFLHAGIQRGRPAVYAVRIALRLRVAHQHAILQIAFASQGFSVEVAERVLVRAVHVRAVQHELGRPVGIFALHDLELLALDAQAAHQVVGQRLAHRALVAVLGGGAREPAMQRVLRLVAGNLVAVPGLVGLVIIELDVVVLVELRLRFHDAVAQAVHHFVGVPGARPVGGLRASGEGLLHQARNQCVREARIPVLVGPQACQHVRRIAVLNGLQEFPGIFRMRRIGLGEGCQHPVQHGLQGLVAGRSLRGLRAQPLLCHPQGVLVELVLRILQFDGVARRPVALGDETRLDALRLVAHDPVARHAALEGVSVDRGVAAAELGRGIVLRARQDAAQPLPDRRGEILELIPDAGEQIRLKLARGSLHLRNHGFPVNRCPKGGGHRLPARLMV
ncbi:hypothetical protein D9M72_59300 [compost metagenome]